VTAREQEVERKCIEELITMKADQPNKLWLVGVVAGMVTMLYITSEKFPLSFIPQLHKKLLDTIK
jgi:hypothetical protein